jgi:flagellar hook-associated protein 1 FlgK
MIGLYSMLNSGSRALQANQAGSEVTGHNIANANNKAYARQRVVFGTSNPVSTSAGQQGTGVDVQGITQLRDALLDGQIQVETSVSGSLTRQQTALKQAEAALGQSVDTSDSSSTSATSSDATGSQTGLGDALNNLFSEFQSLSDDPTSMSERSVLLAKAADLASRFNQIDTRLSGVQDGLNNSLDTDVTKANQLLTDIAALNHKIGSVTSSGQSPNDLMDSRQAKVEELAGLINISVTSSSNNEINIATGDAALITGDQLTDTLGTYDGADGQLLVHTVNGNADLAPTGGSIHGTLEVRDGALKSIQDSVNALASNLITEVNTVHGAGYGLAGNTGATFFTGADASDIAVNSDLTSDPALVQASGDGGSKSDNQVALSLAQLGEKTIDGLRSQTFSASYSTSVAALGQTTASVNSQVSDQTVVENMLTQQRNSVSGVSLDEEMTNMLTYQHAYQASAKVVSAVDEMLNTLINM